MQLILPKIQKYESLDPYWGDRLNNALVQRMIYSSLIEVDQTNRLVSHVLSRFSYDSKTQTIELVLNEQARYSDGSAITVQDLLLPILRVGYYRPEFPVIRDIKGLESWRQKKNFSSLPQGIGVDGSIVRIELIRSHENPLFRFCLELFGIIPARFFDPMTNKIMGAPASSGLFQISSESDSAIEFRKWQDQAHMNSASGAPGKITFVYGSVPATSAEPSVVLSTGFHLLDSDQIMRGRQVVQTPPSFFYSVLLNPEVPPFDSRDCRMAFISAIHEAAAAQVVTLPLEFGLLPRLVPGFLENNEIVKMFDSAATVPQSCLGKLKRPFHWHTLGEKLFDDLIHKALVKVGVPDSGPTIVKDRQEAIDLFAQGKSPFFRFASGFWAQDPSGDLTMMFTPGLHKQLHYLSADRGINSALSQIYGKELANEDAEGFRALNTAVLDSSLIAVVRHFGFVYGFSPSIDAKSLPLAVQLPYPWQLFSPYVQR